MFRGLFDPASPVVASSEFMAGDARVRAGEAFDWRAAGITELDMVTVWWPSGKVTHAMSAPIVTADPDALTESELEKLTAPTVPMGAVLDPGGEKRTFVIDGKSVELTSGPTINVATPEQQALRTQRKKR